MGWTRGKDPASPGQFNYELWDGFRMVERKGGFATAQDADRAAERAQRRLLFGAPISQDHSDLSLSDDELLAELAGPEWQALLA